ncbi:MAG: DUF6894 family protein [Janthinobacterium lividum]
MPLYYFDVYDNERLEPDDFGVELDNLDEARVQAIALLPHMAREASPDGDHHVFKVVVKCEDKRVRYISTLTVEGSWVEPPSSPEPPPRRARARHS